MVSLAATAIHASLVKWDETGSQKSKGFRAEEYQDIYEGHEAFLQSLKAERLKFFHKTMHALHEIVATKKTTSAVLVARQAMSRLSLPDDDQQEV
ncbi:hypothetical protein BDN71DRAFT_1500220 [Pleurotus eryngii]|uniref:DUF6532 domain-containing protein n=1 Tax=Pleurotus eryngii TaxID=5323 RepID=A0A9P6A9H1_PLEER|nr:hypothetical protein BDN71DRAFT_1500220 [Pleurotus eryngii]